MFISSECSLRYELGVMGFNAFNQLDKNSDEFKTSEQFLENCSYDICGNFKSIFNSLGGDIHDLKHGFKSEGANHLYTDSELETMFNKFKKLLF